MPYSLIFSASPIPLEAIKSNVRKFQRKNAARFLCALLAVIMNERRPDDGKLQVELIKDLCSEDIVRKMPFICILLADGFWVFFEKQICFMLNIVLTECDDAPEKLLLDDESKFEEFINLLIRLSDHTDRQTSSSPSDTELLSLTIRSQTFHDRESLGQALARYYYLLKELPEKPILAADENFLPLSEVFKKEAGLEIEEFLALAFGFLAHFGTLTRETLTTISPAASLERFFENTLFAKRPAVKDKIRNLLAIGVDQFTRQYHEDVAQWNMAEPYAFLTVRNKPLITFDETEAYCVSPRFLYEKFTSGLYWMFLNMLPDEQTRFKFQRFLGKIFQEYVGEIFQRIFQKDTEKLALFPKYAGGDEITDIIVDYFPHLFFIEASTARLNLSTMTTGALDLFQKDLEKCFYKPLAQVNRAIENFRSGEFKVNGKGFSSEVKIHPILIHLVSFPQNKHIWLKFLNQGLKERQLLQQPFVEQTQLLDSEELELLESVLQANPRLSFRDLFEKKKEFRRGDYPHDCSLLPFKNFLYEYFNGKIPDNAWLKSYYDKLSGEMKRRSFSQSAS